MPKAARPRKPSLSASRLRRPERNLAPDQTCLELKSLKLYLWSFRDEGHYFEQATNQILDDLVRAVSPRRMTVVGLFNVRGGITTRVVARYERPGPGRVAPRSRGRSNSRS